MRPFHYERERELKELREAVNSVQGPINCANHSFAFAPVRSLLSFAHGAAFADSVGCSHKKSNVGRGD